MFICVYPWLKTCKERNLAQIRVMQSAAFKEAYLELVPPFERASGHKVRSLWVSRVDMLRRLHGGEVVDLVIGPAAGWTT